MTPKADSVSVRVPGSTSNCGSGFDTLGLALNLYNTVRLTRDPGPVARPAGASDSRASEMVAAAVAALSRASGAAPFGFIYRIEGDVPVARGLGSSVTVIAGVLAGLALLQGYPLERRKLVGLVTDIEGHPDNASAGVLGGFCVSRTDPATGAYVETMRFEVPADVAFVVASPPVELVTKESRGALPEALPFFDAVKSVNAASYLVAAFASRDYAQLRHVSADFIHEPYRLARIPGGRDAISSGIAEGAWTGWLSGSGSSVLCVCERGKSATVASAMASAFTRVSMASDIRVLAADNQGLVIEA
ncbi:MAG TPA: homoserine kinase [Opitutaceae bacterium]